MDETSSDKETNALVMTDTKVTNERGQQNRRGLTTRGGISSVLLRQKFLSESEVDETSSDKETNALVMTDTNATNRRGQQTRREPRTRGGISSVQL